MRKEEKNIRPESCSTGEQWFLTFSIFLNDIVPNTRDTIIIIDEPGLSLHPVAQLSICQMMESFVKKHSSIHLIYSTHSPYMINPRNIVSLFHVVRDKEKGTTLYPVDLQELIKTRGNRFGRPNNLSEEAVEKDKEAVETFLYRRMTYEILRGIFSKKVILSEGPTEKLILPIYAEIKGESFENEGFSIITCGGKGSIIDYAELYQLLKIPVFIIFDNDKPKENNNTKENKRLMSFIKKMKEEDEFPTGYGQNYCIFEPNFEGALEENKQYRLFKEKYKGVRQKPIRAVRIAHEFEEQKMEIPKVMERLICVIFKGK